MDEIKLCTACLTVNQKMHSLDLKIMTRSVRDIIATISEIQVNVETGYVCSDCVNFLYKVEKFRKQCIESLSHQSTTIVSQTDGEYIIPVQFDDVHPKTEVNVDQEDGYYQEECLSENNSANNEYYSDNSSQELQDFEMYGYESDSKHSIGISVDLSDDKDFASDGDSLKVYKEYLIIHLVELEDAKAQILAKKDMDLYKNSQFQCEFCYRGYKSKSTFDNHIKKHSIESGKFECEVCKLRFHTMNSCSKHFQTTHRYKISCKLCPYYGYSIPQAKLHVNVQHKGKKFTCRECNEIFSSPRQLHQHKLLFHAVNCREAVCPLCGLTFITPTGLHLHELKLHKHEKNENAGPYCKECDVQFSNKEAWERHLKIAAKHNFVNNCKLCGESFETEELLTLHVENSHPDEKPVIDGSSVFCTLCSKEFTRRSFRPHMAAAHPDEMPERRRKAAERGPFVCEHCGLSYKMKCHLKYHVRRHTGERPYSCTLCGARFNQPAQYYAHRAGHRYRPQCSICGRVYKYMYGLSKHMRMHLGIRPHKCTSCDKTFINRCDLQLHVKHVHEKVPWPKRVRNRNKNEANKVTITAN